MAILSRMLDSFREMLSDSDVIRITRLEKRLDDVAGKGDEVGLIGKLESRISDVEGHVNSLKDGGIKKGITTFNIFVGVFFITIIIGTRIFSQMGAIKFADFLAYALPLVAAFLAGAGLYKGDALKAGRGGSYENMLTARLFEASVVFLVSGLAAYIFSKKQALNVSFDLFGVFGLVVSLILFGRNATALKGKPTTGDKVLRPIAISLLVLSLLLAVAWMVVIWKSSPDWGPKLFPSMKQHVDGSANNGKQSDGGSDESESCAPGS